MKRFYALVSALLLVAFAVPALAGDYGKCTADAQACLDHMAAKFEKKGWVGLELDKSDKDYGYVITAVVPDSPADKAGFKEGDLLAAVNGIQLSEANEAKLKEAKEGMTIGAAVVYTVERKGKSKEIEVTLAKMPGEVMAQWIGYHMMNDHVSTAAADDD